LEGRPVARLGTLPVLFSFFLGIASSLRGGEPSPHLNLIQIDGSINPAVGDFIKESINRSYAEGAKGLIIQLDTPGGLLTSTRTIVKDLLGAPLPMIVYVAPSGAGAGSAGVFITMAAHIAAMAPGTNIGAAHPVGGQGQDVKGNMGEKIENFTASFSEAIAQKRGRNTEWAIKAVRESVAITEREALSKRVIDVVAVDLPDLLTQLEGRQVEIQEGKKLILSFKGAQIKTVEMNLKQKVINALADPNIAYLLMLAGIVGLYFEFAHPGVVFPGVAGAICLLLALASFQILPINYTGLALIVLGLALLIAEVFVQSFGVLGVGGAVAFGLGSLMLFQTPTSDLSLDWSIAVTAAMTLGLFVVGVGYLVLKTQRTRSVAGFEGLIGEIGEVRSRINPRGKIFVHGEYWDAESDELLEVGERARVVGQSAMTLRVKPLLSLDSAGRKGENSWTS
jgi:membrane-bound serine protease (ClpP class)